MSGIESFLNTYGLPAIFVVLLIKSIGVPIPIPSDVIMLFAAGRVTDGKLILWQAFSVLLVAIIIGDVIQFLLVRGPGRQLLYRFGRYIGLTAAHLDAAASVVKKSNPIGLGVIILTPGIRAASVAACGLADVPLNTFAIGLLLGEGVFLALHFVLGPIIGTLLDQMSRFISLPILIATVIAVIVLSLGVWFVIRRRQRPALSRRQLIADSFEAWHSAACPACLAIGVVSRVNQQV